MYVVIRYEESEEEFGGDVAAVEGPFDTAAEADNAGVEGYAKRGHYDVFEVKS